MDELAKKKGASMAQISIAWILARPGVTAPVVGTTSLSHLKDIFGAYTLRRAFGAPLLVRF